MAVATPVGYQPGDVIEYTAGGAVSQYEIIELGNNSGLIGVALEAAAASGDIIGVAIGGVFTFPKVSGAVIAQCEAVDWDTSAGEVDDDQATSATGDYPNFGTAVEAKGNGTTTVRVKLNGFGGTIT